MKKTNEPRIIIAVDYGRRDMTTECVVRHNPDGTFEVLEIFQYNQELVLDKSEYRMK